MTQTVLITGAARRVGAACARLLHESGCNVVLHYRASAGDAQALCEELNGVRPGSARALQADLLVMEEIEGLAQQAGSIWDGIDALVNNASSFYPAEFSVVTEVHWRELMGTNLKAPFFLAQALLPLLTSRRGCIVNIADIHAERGLKGYPVYSIAKAGLIAMTRILAKELGPDVRVNAISPGAVMWPERPMSEAAKREIIERVALKHSGEPLDIARAVRFLINEADYITGQVLTVDGGRTLFC